MARKTAIVTIDDKGRDKGKTFLITELPVFQAEKWALRAISALIKAGFEIPDETAGMAAIAAQGFESLGKLDFDIAESLLDEMFKCVQIIPSPNAPARALIDDDIEEVKTALKLRVETFKLHVDFS